MLLGQHVLDAPVQKPAISVPGLLQKKACCTCGNLPTAAVSCQGAIVLVYKHEGHRCIPLGWASRGQLKLPYPEKPPSLHV